MQKDHLKWTISNMEILLQIPLTQHKWQFKSKSALNNSFESIYYNINGAIISAIRKITVD